MRAMTSPMTTTMWAGAIAAALALGACNPKGDEGPPNDPTPNGPITPPPAAPAPAAAAPDADPAAELAELAKEIDEDDAAETE